MDGGDGAALVGCASKRPPRPMVPVPGPGCSVYTMAGSGLPARAPRPPVLTSAANTAGPIVLPSQHLLHE